MAELGLFEGYGIELEYMLVDVQTLAVAPIADRVLATAAGEPCSAIEVGPIAWSNELALHVIEVKTNGPVAELSAASEERSFDGNSLVFRKDDPCDGLYVVSRGGVVVRNEVCGRPLERVRSLPT